MLRGPSKWLWGGVCCGTWAAGMTLPAGAGVVAVSRETLLRVSGAAGGEDYERTDGTTTFDAFDDLLEGAVNPGGGSSAASSAGQTSALTGDPGALAGGSAQGSAAGRVGEFDSMAAFGESLFSLTFRVTDGLVPMSLAGSLGGTVGGSASVRLTDEASSGALFESVVDQGNPESAQVLEERVLGPGLYTLSIRAFVSGTPSGDAAFFNATFQFDDGGGAPPPVPVPLPPAVWSGLVGLGVAGAAAHLLSRRHPWASGR